LAKEDIQRCVRNTITYTSKVNKINTLKVCKPVHHHTIQINQPTRCNNFSSLLLDVGPNTTNSTATTMLQR